MYFVTRHFHSRMSLVWHFGWVGGTRCTWQNNLSDAMAVSLTRDGTWCDNATIHYILTRSGPTLAQSSSPIIKSYSSSIVRLYSCSILRSIISSIVACIVKVTEWWRKIVELTKLHETSTVRTTVHGRNGDHLMRQHVVGDRIPYRFHGPVQERYAPSTYRLERYAPSSSLMNVASVRPWTLFDRELRRV